MIKNMEALRGKGKGKSAAAKKKDKKTASKKVVSFKLVKVAIKDIDTASQKVHTEFGSGREFKVAELKETIALLKDMSREAATQYRDTLALVAVALKKGVKTASVEESVEDLSILRSRLAMLTVQAETSLMQVDQNAYVVAEGEGGDAEAEGEGDDEGDELDDLTLESEGAEGDDLDLELEPEDEGDIGSEGGEEGEGDFEDLEDEGDEGFEDLEGDFEDLEGDIDSDLLMDDEELETEPASAEGQTAKKSTTSKKRATASKKKTSSEGDMLSAVVSDGFLED